MVHILVEREIRRITKGVVRRLKIYASDIWTDLAVRAVDDSLADPCNNRLLRNIGNVWGYVLGNTRHVIPRIYGDRLEDVDERPSETNLV